MVEGKLFEPSSLESWGEERPRPAKTRRGEARVNRPQRDQIEWTQVDAETLIPEDHVARAIWSYLERMELSAFYESVKSVGGGPGRPATDPQVLLALWMLATVDGVGSARRLARLCEEHNGYRWLRWNVPVNYHMLSDFRVANQSGLDDLLTQVVDVDPGGHGESEAGGPGRDASAGQRGVGTFRGKGAETKSERGPQAGEAPSRKNGNIRIRKRPIGNGRRERGRPGRGRNGCGRPWNSCRWPRRRRSGNVGLQVEGPTGESDQGAGVHHGPPGKGDEDAGWGVPSRLQRGTGHGRRPRRDSGSGGHHSGYNAGQAAPMEEQVEERTGRRPHSYLMDGGFATREDITILEHRGVRVYAPVRLPRNKPEEERYLPRYGDGEEVVRWRRRMATEEAKAIYRRRCAIAEWANAQARMHGVSQFNVRGLAKVTSVMLLVAVAHNFLRWRALVA